VEGAQKSGKNIFLAIFYGKLGHFSGKNHAKFGNFVNFLGKYHKNSGILLLFGKESDKIRACC